MQYGHCVTCATATAMSCLVFSGNAPSANTRWPNARKALLISGASSRRLRAISLVVSGYIGCSIGHAPFGFDRSLAGRRPRTALDPLHHIRIARLAMRVGGLAEGATYYVS